MGNDVLIIGEIGINHNGSIDIAKQIIDIAVDAGCDMVKFQKRTPELCVPDDQKNVMRDTPWGHMTYLEYKQRIEFGKPEYDEIDRYCKAKGVDWFASSWDLESQKFLQQYNLKYNKIASAMLTYEELLNMVAIEGKHTFISTGMSTMDEVYKAGELFIEKDCPFTIMACTSTYPCDVSECNIRFVETLKKAYPESIGIGYSGHEKGILPTALAVALGATVIERHITIDRTMWGSDHAASLGPDGINRLCRDIRNVSKILGDGIKIVYDSEKPIKQKLRKF
jgi:N-acetylneuraminate synthase